MEQFRLRDIAKSFSIDIQERSLPKDEEVETTVSQRVIALLEAKMRMRDRLQVEHMQRFIPQVKRLLQNEEEMDLIAMLVDDFYMATLNTPPPQPPEVQKSSVFAEGPEAASGAKKKRRHRKSSAAWPEADRTAANPREKRKGINFSLPQ
jgi:ATP-dependent RNA helicase DeaD